MPAAMSEIHAVAHASFRVQPRTKPPSPSPESVWIWWCLPSASQDPCSCVHARTKIGFAFLILVFTSSICKSGLALA
ncbi:hypothetical protein BRADI_3g34765v3 [Brachypodium distachyon]|uniref:Uncharacterized protein n=1 Tax=Brachypodium distachyon TaxID=15368 RepID=A0A2K2D164_BRADI|nr:hypothetical protein BRADI_3g34765v3 [Brachypodium distachyon]